MPIRLYTDNQNFLHTVFYDRSKRKYIKLIHNPKGQFCSSAEYTREQINNQVAGMKRLKESEVKVNLHA